MSQLRDRRKNRDVYFLILDTDHVDTNAQGVRLLHVLDAFSLMNRKLLFSHRGGLPDNRLSIINLHRKDHHLLLDAGQHRVFFNDEGLRQLVQRLILK